MTSHDDSSVGIDRTRFHSPLGGPFHDATSVYAFFGGGGRGAIVDRIVHDRAEARATVHVHGERGSGRTLLSLVLAERLADVCNVIRHDRPASTRTHLLRHLLTELCPAEAHIIDAAASRDGAAPEETLARASRHVLARLSLTAPPGHRPYLLIVDTSSTPDEATLALLDLLAGVRRDGAPAMHVVLFRVSDPIDARTMPDGAARPDGHHHLRRLTLAEVGAYLHHRMMLFDFARRDLFTREMIYFVADRSGGVLGRIDTLARNAFTLAGLEDDERPSLAHLLATGLPPRPERASSAPFLSRHRRAFVALFGSCVVVSTAVAVLVLGH